ncbi:hypothetical protein HanIR_Chr10g0481551 [Helianthus annuus]|nr:hypothetical protein HanIR_Chr10g0481551 [Helianthus annuus]
MPYLMYFICCILHTSNTPTLELLLVLKQNSLICGLHSQMEWVEEKVLACHRVSGIQDFFLGFYFYLFTILFVMIYLERFIG